jgi:hypothetical protein
MTRSQPLAALRLQVSGLRPPATRLSRRSSAKADHSSLVTSHTGSPAVIDRIVGRVVGEELFQTGALPIEVFGLASDQIRKIAVNLQTLRPRQLFDRLFDLLHRAHPRKISGVTCHPQPKDTPSLWRLICSRISWSPRRNRSRRHAMKTDASHRPLFLASLHHALATRPSGRFALYLGSTHGTRFFGFPTRAQG